MTNSEDDDGNVIGAWPRPAMAADADVVERLLRRAAERRGGLRTFVAKRPQAEQIRKRSVANAELDERAAAEIERLRSTLHRPLSRYDRLDEADPLYMIKGEIEAVRAALTTTEKTDGEV